MVFLIVIYCHLMQYSFLPLEKKPKEMHRKKHVTSNEKEKNSFTFFFLFSLLLYFYL